MTLSSKLFDPTANYHERTDVSNMVTCVRCVVFARSDVGERQRIEKVHIHADYASSMQVVSFEVADCGEDSSLCAWFADITSFFK